MAEWENWQGEWSGISGGGHLKSVIRSFAADYSPLPNRDWLAAQTASESRLESDIKSGDSEDVSVARAELASLLITKDWALVITGRLKRFPRRQTRPLNCGKKNCVERLIITLPNGGLRTKALVRTFGPFFKNSSPASPNWGLLSSASICPTFSVSRAKDLVGKTDQYSAVLQVESSQTKFPRASW